MAKLTRREKETICRFSEDNEDLMTLETFNQRQALRLIKAGATVKVTREHGGFTYWTLEMPNRWFKWPRAPKKMSEAMTAALTAAREKALKVEGENEEEQDPGEGE